MEKFESKYMIEKEVKLFHWGNGEWVDEPDIIQFEYREIKCFVCRNMGWEGLNKEHLYGGNLCGYICIPDGHIFFGNDYNDIDIEVHGGLTFGEKTGNEFFIGFDCAHSFDIVPSIEKFKREGMTKDPFLDEMKQKYPDSPIWDSSYKNVEFCVQECKSMVDQILEKNMGSNDNLHT